MHLGKEAALTALYVAGSVASIVGAFTSVYVLRKEKGIQADVTALKSEEESWHKAKEKNS